MFILVIPHILLVYYYGQISLLTSNLSVSDGLGHIICFYYLYPIQMFPNKIILRCDDINIQQVNSITIQTIWI